MVVRVHGVDVVWVRFPALRHDNADVVELADTHGSGPCSRKGVGVRLSPSAHHLRSKYKEVRRKNIARFTGIKYLLLTSFFFLLKTGHSIPVVRTLRVRVDWVQFPVPRQ